MNDKPRESRPMGCEAENAKLLDEYLKDLRVGERSEHTIVSFAFSIRDFLKFTLGLDVLQVTHHDIREWLHWLTVQKFDPRTISSRRAALASFFLFLQKTDMVKESPLRFIASPKFRRRLPRTLTVEEVEKLIDATETPRDRALVAVMYATGCRIT